MFDVNVCDEEGVEPFGGGGGVVDGCGGGGGGWGEVEGRMEGGDWEYCGHRVVGEGDDETIYTILSQTFCCCV